jgi:hypothetical protein
MSVRFQLDRDRADRSLEDVFTRLDPSHMFQSSYQSDRPMAAHAEIADIVKEDHTRDCRVIHRFAQKRADDGLITSRLANDGRTQFVVLVPEKFKPLSHCSAAEIRETRNYDPGRFAARV